MTPTDPQLRILLVDDDADLSGNLSDILEAEGFQTQGARDGKTALALAKTKNFDLALVDMRLPDMPGMELVEALGRLSPSTDYVIITGYASLESAVEAVRKKNILAYETKPMNIEHLLALTRQVAQRRRLEREVLGIAEEERQKFGRELHDGLGQLLTGAALQAKFLADALQEQKGPASEVAQGLAGLINQAITESSRLAQGLTPVSLETKGLVSALEELIWQAGQASGMDCTLKIDADVLLPEQHVAIHLYRIVQEALNNALKHGKATKVQIRLTANGAGGLLEVTDNGRGIREDDRKKSGMGLKIMDYRASLLGGSFEIISNPDGGTRIRLRYRV